MAQAKMKERRKPLHIRSGDDVIVISGEGRDPSTPRKVLQVFPQEGKVLIEGVNIVKDRQKNRNPNDNSAINQQDFIEKPMPIDASNVALVDPRTRKRTRVRMKIEANGQKTRVATKSGDNI